MHSALNALCQGCAADLLKWGMVRTHAGLTDSFYRSHLVNTVHDELMLDCTLDELADLAIKLPDWMTDARIDSVVPIRPECEVSYTSWADKEPYGRDGNE
jgi:DNA polymerase I-like protein with 3'-5' exonuclease and polymerase domains